jgi:small subunit ribosomal protein S2
MKAVSLEELLEAGCHFGHQTTRHNPKARDYIFEARDGIHIIDLEKTKEGLDEAVDFVQKLAARGGTMIILGSKRQAAPIVREEYKKAQEAGVEGLYVVTNRWIGGILTNFPEVTKNFQRLKDINGRLQNDFERSKYTKKEIALWEKERNKLESFYGGISSMTRPADALFIIDTHLEQLAVREAKATGVAIVGITDTNADPTDIDYPIPANDDAVGSIRLLTATIVAAFMEGKKKAAADAEKAAKKEAEDAKKAAEKEEKAPAKKSEEKSETKTADTTPVKLASDKKKETPLRQGSAGQATNGKVETKAVNLAKEKKEETAGTPEKISKE